MIMFLGARMIRDSAAPSTMLRMVPLPRCAGADAERRPRGALLSAPATRGRIRDSALAAPLMRPSFCSPRRQGKLLPLINEGSGAPRGACRSCPRCANKCTQSAPLVCTAAAQPLREARPPFGAHACGTRHRLSPRWLSPRTGFPQGTAFRSFARSPHAPCVKHAPCGPVLLPVDRGPRAARERSA
jgi:hypothetical protein